MSTAHNTNEESIYYEAVAKAPAEREVYLQAVCGPDAALLARVKKLLAAREVRDNFLVSSPWDPAVMPDTSAVTEGPGTVIGRYKLLEKIGEGGMAVVYLAEQTEPLRRKVALKIIKLGMDTRQVIARFEAERQALALMDHPSIAKVLDAGATETGRPYFVMELVQGVSITEYCDRNTLSTKDRLALFVQVCQAVQHAHQKGIIHRDIKPSNVMVTHHDGKPVPKVIDFGIAKAINQKLTEKTLFTRYAHLIGTPGYMSPEQAELSDLDIDTRSDIYSLGVLLYELLTGTTPFSEEELRKAGYIEMQRVIREQEPAKPSTRIRTLDATRASVRQARSANGVRGTPYQQVRGDLDWIVMKSLEKDRARRYETASGLAEDIRRHLDSEPVMARGPGTAYRLRKFLRRQRVQLLVGSTVAVLMAVVAVILSVWNQDRLQVVAAQHKAILSQAQGEYARGERQAALETIQGIVDSKRVGPDARLLCASILVEDRRSEEAMTLLGKLIHERAEIAGAAYALLARTIWEGPSLGPEEVRRAEEYQEKTVDLHPKTAAAYYLRAMGALTIHEKLDLLTEAVRLERDYYPSRRLQALIHLASRRYEDLKDDALMMTDRWPGDPLGYSLRAIAWRELGRYREAIADFNEALARTPRDDPQCVELAAKRCETFLRMADYERVIPEAKGCLTSWPDKPVFQQYLFCALTALGDYEEAQTVFRQIVRPAQESRSPFDDWRGKYVFDTLATGRSWYPPGSKPAGAAFLPMVEAEETYHGLSAKAKRVIADGFSGQWSPDGKKLAFSLGVQGYSGVAIFDPATKETDLLIVPGKDPRWSPDGKFIAFVRDCQVLRVPEFVAAERRSQDRPRLDEEVWVINSDGTEPRRLAAGGYPSWGQDSTCVYYQSRADNNFNSISIVDRDAKPKQLMTCTYAFPSVSPDSRRVAYLEGRSLRVKDLDSKGLVAEWPISGVMGMPEWSPSGDELCVEIAGGVWNTTGLWIYPLDGREPVKVLGGQLIMRGGTWAADGSRLVFHLAPPYFEIWSADLDPNVSVIEALAPGQTLEEYWRDMVRLCTRRIETDPNAYCDRAWCYDRLREQTKVDADMRQWVAIVSGGAGPGTPPAEADLAFGQAVPLPAPINSPSDEQRPCVSPDGLELYWSSNRPGGSGGFDIWMARRASVEEPWGPPIHLESPLNMGTYESVGSMSADGLTLYLYVERARDGTGAGQRDLFTSTRTTKDAPWGPPANLGSIVNSLSLDGDPVISPDGRELYFTSNRPGGYRYGDIWVSRRTSRSDPWGPPVNLGPTINTPYTEWCEWMSSDGLRFAFSSLRPGGFGNLDVWMTTRPSTDDPWSPPTNLGPSINTEYNESFKGVSPDGQWCYFASDRPGGQGGSDIWQAPIIPKAGFNGGTKTKTKED